MRLLSEAQHTGRVRAADILTKAYLHQEYLVCGRTPAEIGASIGVSQRNVRAYLHKHGVTRREHLANLLTESSLRQAYIEQGRTPDAISAEIGVSRATVHSYLRQYDIPLRPQGYHLRRYNAISSAGFEDLTTDWHTYWVGFLAADGYIRADDREHAVHLRLKASDAHHLAALKEGLCAEAPVQYLPNRGYPAAQLILRDHALVAALIQWGVTPNKSMNLSWPERLPDMLIPAYIRGYFDGDGTVYQRQRSSTNSTWRETVCRFISGSKSFLDRLADELTQRGIRVRKLYRNPNSNTNVLPLSTTRSNLLAFASLIYDGSTVALERKRAVFESLREQLGRAVA
jgi:DNA-binding CsgD family transcriptional regulator